MGSNNIQTDKIEYSKLFDVFKASSDGKVKYPKIQRILLQRLQSNGIVFTGNQPIKIADICCGPVDRTIASLQNIDFTPGFDIRATDINSDFTGVKLREEGQNSSISTKSEPGLGIAVENLMKAKKSQIIPLRNFSVKGGNAFKANLLDLLSIDDETANEKNTFSLALVAHSLYYVWRYKPVENTMEKFMDSVLNNILSDNGIALLSHFVINPSSHFTLEYKYTYKIKGSITAVEGYRNLSSDYLIETYCNKHGLAYYNFHYTINYEFDPNTYKYKDILKNPHRYNELHDKPAVVNDLYKMLFIGHRSPNDLYSDKSEFGLANLVDELLDVIQEYGCLRYKCMIYVIPTGKVSKEYKTKIKSVVHSVQETIAQLEFDK